MDSGMRRFLDKGGNKFSFPWITSVNTFVQLCTCDKKGSMRRKSRRPLLHPSASFFCGNELKNEKIYLAMHNVFCYYAPAQRSWIGGHDVLGCFRPRPRLDRGLDLAGVLTWAKLQLSLWNFNIMLPITRARMGLLFCAFRCTVSLRTTVHLVFFGEQNLSTNNNS
jgi:hypothetical protein